MSTTMTATITSTARATPSSTVASTSTLNSNTLATPSESLATTATTTTRVRFDAECVLIPDVPFTSSKRPRMLTKSYSLPLWRKQRPQREEEQEHVVLKVALPSFKSGSKTRPTSRSPPPVAHSIPSCLRSPPLSSSAPSSLLASASAPADMHAAPSSAPADTHMSAHTHTPRPLATILAVYTSPAASATVYAGAGAGTKRTVPLRKCCPECAARAEVAEEAFSRGAQRVRRRAGSAGGAGSLFLAAQAGGFLEPMAAASLHPQGQGGEGQGLMSGTGLAEVNRLVAELERRRASATPSPVGGPPTPPVSASGGHGDGRASPSLLGPALARVVEGGRLSADGSRNGSRQGSRHGSGRASPLLPLGIAVDEVDKVRRRRSADVGAMRSSARALGGEVVVLGDADDAVPVSAPAGSAAFAPRRLAGTPPPKNTRAMQAYADDDDAELFPLPSRGGTPNASPSPRPSPRGSPAGSASDVNVTRAGRGSPLAGGREPAYVAGGASPSGSDGGGGGGKEGRERERERERRSRSEAVCVALGAAGRREREEREREGEREAVAMAMATCGRGLLLPPGDERDLRARGDGHGSRESSVSRGSDAGSEGEARDLEKPLPVLPRLATSVLAAGPYSPALAPRVYPAGMGRPSYHLRGASAPADAGAGVQDEVPPPVPASASTSTAPAAPSTPSTSPSTPTAKTAAASPSPTAASTIGTTPPSPSNTSPRPPQAAPPLLRSSSGVRLRSQSTSSGKAGRSAFGALVGVLKGVTSMSGPGVAV